MGKRATKYIENLKKNNAARAKEERDAFLIEHHFTETVIDENGREKIVPETVTDEEYKILREALYVDEDQKKREEKASAGSFAEFFGGLILFAGICFFAYCLIELEIPTLAWATLFSSVVLSILFFAVGKIQRELCMIHVSAEISEKTLKEILKYAKAHGSSKGNSQENEVVESCSVESAEEANLLQEISTKCDEARLQIEKEERSKAVPSCLIDGKQSNENHREDKPENQPSAKKTSSSDETTVIVICSIAIIIVIAILVGVYLFLS